MNPSRMYNFVRSRQLEGTYPGEPSTGIWISTSFRILKGWGAPTEDEWPYDGDASHWPPVEPRDIDVQAKAHRIFAYVRANTRNDFRDLLAQGLPVCTAVKIDDSWSRAPNGLIANPAMFDSSGLHTIRLVGYDDGKGWFIFANSWGVTWGDGGYGYLPYEYFPSRFLEAWTIIDSGPSPNPKNAGIEERSWGIPNPLGGVLHGVEIIDWSIDELIGWAFAAETDGFLDIQELCVRPKWRRQACGGRIAADLKGRAAKLGVPLRAWVPHSDAGRRNRPQLLSIFRRLDISPGPSTVPWAAEVAK
jgi:GNAT superfamily N-acetyltransferase